MFFPSGCRSTLRISETLAQAGRRFPDDYLGDMTAPPGLDCSPSRLGGTSAFSRAFVRPDTRPMQIRQWVASDGRYVVFVTHEVPLEVGDAEHAAVDAMLATLHLRHQPHPVVAALLERLGKEWGWDYQAPFEIRCPRHRLNVEMLVRTIDLHPGTQHRDFDQIARRIQNLNAFGASRPSLDMVRPSIFPLIRGPVVLESLSARQRLEAEHAPVDGTRLQRRAWGPDLFVYYAVDVPGSFYFLRPADLTAWGTSAEDIERIALANLKQHLGASDTFQFLRSGAYKFLSLEDGEGLAASRLLLPHFRSCLESALGREFAAAVPSAGVLIAFTLGFTGWRDLLGEDVWDAYLAEPVPVSTHLYRVGPGAVTLASPESAC